MTRRLLWVLMALVAVVGGAACGGDDDDAAADVDWSAVSEDVSETVSSVQPGVEAVEVTRDGKTLKFDFTLNRDDGETPDDAGGFAMLSVQVLEKDHPEVLDGVREVQSRLGEDNYTYPYSEVQAWIEERGVDYPDF